MSSHPTTDLLSFRWRLSELAPLEGATCSIVYSAVRSVGEEAVLKLPLDPEEATSGVRCLRAFSRHGGVPVLECDEESGAILMARGGRTLADAVPDDQEAATIMAGAIRRLREAPVADVKPLSHWFRDLRSAAQSSDNSLLQRALEVSDWLFTTSPEPTLLHGDLHHFNLLQSGDEWWAIDPKGVLGDPAFEPSAFLRNPVPAIAHDPDLVGKEARRIRIFADELSDDPRRIWGWGFAQTALSGVWSEGDWSTNWIRVAEALWTVGQNQGYWEG